MAHVGSNPVTDDMRRNVVRRFDEILSRVGNVRPSVTGTALEMEIHGRCRSREDYLATANRVLMKLAQRSQGALPASNSMPRMTVPRTVNQPTQSVGLFSAVTNPYPSTSNTIAMTAPTMIQQTRVVEAPVTAVTALQQSSAPHVTYTAIHESVMSHLQPMQSSMTVVSQPNSSLSTVGPGVVQQDSQLHNYLRATQPAPLPVMSVAPVSTIGPLPISVMPSYPGPSMPVTATRIAPVAEVPVHSTMTSSLPPSFDSVTMVQRMQPPSVPTASTTQSSVARTTSATAPPSATEEQLYMEKLNQLSKYINPVKRMLNRMSRDKRSPREIQKLRSLLEILENPLKKVPLNVLETCETVLGRLINEGPVASPPVVPTTSTVPVTKATLPVLPASSKGGAHLMFPLIKTVARVSESSTLAHNMQMSFNTALRTVHGPVIRHHATDEPFPEERLPKRMKKCPDSDSELPHVLERELTHIKQQGKFNVEIAPSSNGTVAMTGRTLSFSLISSPDVPHIDIQIPNDYPSHCPKLLPFNVPTAQNLLTAYGVLQSKLRNLPGGFTLTQLLRAWELSVHYVHGMQQVQVEHQVA